MPKLHYTQLCVLHLSFAACYPRLDNHMQRMLLLLLLLPAFLSTSLHIPRSMPKLPQPAATDVYCLILAAAAVLSRLPLF
jgi:hypothetical protein